ncbi:PP2C family protein-serine/threonine phosphatase [Nakamurella aerolata]|uniref:PP2C family protein-serine/threonine phosphatase n=1 Tax=Nakamurella aerolata TaxID=1656892 RepID=UPI001BB1CE77
MRRYSITAVGRTHVGRVKPNNEDAFHIGSGLILVADGVGGSAAGEVASRTVVDMFATVEREHAERRAATLAVGAGASADGARVRADETGADRTGADRTGADETGVDRAGADEAAAVDIYALLSDAVERSTHSLLEQVQADPELEGMGTTVTAMMWSGGPLVFAQIGDSRAYFVSAGGPGAQPRTEQPAELHQVTKDDSFVQYLIDRGLLQPSEASTHPRRNVILKALNGMTVAPSFATFAPRPGDRFLLCSDGLSDYVPAADILGAIDQTPADAAADRLIELALGAGAPDNVTVIIADVLAA